jgi:hypothetical protein
MKRIVVVVVAAAGVVAAAAWAGGFVTTPPAAPAGQQVYFGHIKSIAPHGSKLWLRFDPAWFLSGVTASRAALEDTGSADVPNDNYVVEEGHRLLTFVLPPTARVTVLTNDGSGISSTPIPVSELRRIVAGKTTKHKLFEPLESGVWIRVRIDTIQEVDQQYRP